MRARSSLGRLVGLAGLAVFGCETAPQRLEAPRSASGVELAPYAVHEECFRLAAGERIDFYFVSTAPVAFNLHYHEANAVILPIERNNATEASGDFTADRNEVHCLMWEAGAEATLLDYRVRPLPRRQRSEQRVGTRERLASGGRASASGRGGRHSTWNLRCPAQGGRTLRAPR
ncbi:MAG TPA: hypothetical protein VF814_09970 [Casimicrobiaceae bacterium]